MDCNSYSYAPYMLDGEKESIKHDDKYYYWINHDIRVITLDLCCDFIKDYRSASLETKNFIYDIVQNKVRSLI